MSNATLDEQLDVRSATAWYPWKGEGDGQPTKITGEVAAIDSVYSDYQQELRLIVVIRAEDGTSWNLRTYPTRLHAEWLRLQPKIGERVAVQYVGMCTRKQDSKQYPDFAIAVEREEPEEFDYSKVGAPKDDADGDGVALGSTDLEKRIPREVAEARIAQERDETEGEPVGVGASVESAVAPNGDDDIPF
jgi:hypothetical protein